MENTIPSIITATGTLAIIIILSGVFLLFIKETFLKLSHSADFVIGKILEKIIAVGVAVFLLVSIATFVVLTISFINGVI